MLRSIRLIASASLMCAALVGCDAPGEDAIGPEGGSVISEDGRLTIDIPEGALDEAVEITIEEVDELPEGAVGPAYEIHPVGTVFNSPVHVLYNYGAAGADLDTDQIDFVIEREDGWTALADRFVFEDDNIISASALYLSTFCVVEG